MRLGIDLGGTKTEGILLDELGAEVLRVRRPTPREEGYEAILQNIEEIVQQLRGTGAKEISSIGIGTPGTLDRSTQTLRGSNSQCLNGKPIQKDLERMLGLSVIIENDANCFALAEAAFGAGKGSELVFGIIMGTGVGGGISYQGRCLSGRQGIAGEWGHNVLEPGGEECYCGKRGCVETELSGPNWEKYYARISGNQKSLAEIVQAAESGEPAAQQTLETKLKQFGKAISVVINILDPDLIVLGGGVSNVAYLEKHAVEAVRPFVFHPQPDVRIVKNLLGDSAGVFGAAMLNPD